MTTNIARLDCDEQTARRLVMTLDELSDDAAIATFEREDGRWTVEITFDVVPDERAVRAMIGEQAGPQAATALQFDTIEQRDWVARASTGSRCAPAASSSMARTIGALPANTIGIEIEAALAFGTGHHGTTRGCLLAIDRLAKRRSYDGCSISAPAPACWLSPLHGGSAASSCQRHRPGGGQGRAWQCRS